MNNPIVTSKWLRSRLNDLDLVILNASQQDNKSRVSTEFDRLQIVGARNFDLKNDFSLVDSDLPSMMPTAKQFEKAARKLGINNSSKIIVYDNLGIYFSPRVWWMFKAMGHKNVSVLNGGLPDWINHSFPTEAKESKKITIGDFHSLLKTDSIKSFEFIKDNIKKQEHILIDARSSDRFNGIALEPRKGLRSGNIKNSINLPYTEVLVKEKFKSKEQLIELFNNLKVDDHPLIFSCGSGVTACIILLASDLVLKNKKSVYDGSWTEWAQKTLQ